MFPMPRQRTSFIWEYFTKHENGAAVCDTCNRRIVVNGGSTSNLIKHLRCKHKDILQDPATMGEGEMATKEEYILLQGEPTENYEEFIDDENGKIELGETTQFEEISLPKAKKSKHTHLEGDFRMKPIYLSETVRRSPLKNRGEKEREDSSLDIFAKYMVSLMRDMPKKKCEEAQLKIVSVILEAKRDDTAAETKE